MRSTAVTPLVRDPHHARPKKRPLCEAKQTKASDRRNCYDSSQKLPTNQTFGTAVGVIRKQAFVYATGPKIDGCSRAVQGPHLPSAKN